MVAIQLTGHIDEDGRIELSEQTDLPPGDVKITIEPVSAEAEAADEARWDALFAASQDLLAEMANRAARDWDAGLAGDLDPEALCGMKSKRLPEFIDTYAKLPNTIKRRAQAAYRLFKQDPYHPSLQFKRVHDIQPIYSVRIGLDYRALGLKRGDEIGWFWIGHHTLYNKLLKKF